VGDYDYDYDYYYYYYYYYFKVLWFTVERQSGRPVRDWMLRRYCVLLLLRFDRIGRLTRFSQIS